MKARIRDFIHTTDDLFFATTNYAHPSNKILAFLRYIPDENGDREKDGKRYSKVDSQQAYEYIRENCTEYLYFSNVTKEEMIAVPHNKIESIIRPEERLKEIMDTYKPETADQFTKNLISLAEIFYKEAGIPYENLGISGSTLPGLQKPGTSDLDFVIYGLENHQKAMQTFSQIKDTNKIPDTKIESINNEFWGKLYTKRIKDDTLTPEEFQWYENRKNNRGIINGVLFDILATKNWDEINEKWGDITYEPVKNNITIEATITNTIGAYDNPATYKIKDAQTLNGKKSPITEIASLTHTYSGQVKNNEKIIARGRQERIIKKERIIGQRLLIGTTREALNEFIKIKNNTLPTE